MFYFVLLVVGGEGLSGMQRFVDTGAVGSARKCSFDVPVCSVLCCSLCSVSALVFSALCARKSHAINIQLCALQLDALLTALQKGVTDAVASVLLSTLKALMNNDFGLKTVIGFPDAVNTITLLVIHSHDAVRLQVIGR